MVDWVLAYAHCWVEDWLNDFLALAHRDSCCGLLCSEEPFAPFGQYSYVPLPFFRSDIKVCFGVTIIECVTPFSEQITL